LHGKGYIGPPAFIENPPDDFDVRFKPFQVLIIYAPEFRCLKRIQVLLEKIQDAKIIVDKLLYDIKEDINDLIVIIVGKQLPADVVQHS
jgi:hypothetical protein